MTIPFNRPYVAGNELEYIASATNSGHLSGDGQFTKRCSEWLEENTGSSKALLTPSCTAALEMAALLIEIGPGDEVIMPSYTFVSTANAFVLRGAIPVFVDIRSDTLNIDEKLIEDAITSRTKAICVVHYAGVSCEMDEIMEIGQRHGLVVVEDAAQGIMSLYKGKALGTFGDFGTFSFHETKNVIAGEGGALLCRDSTFVERAEIIREKGTNRSLFFRGQVDKYTWVNHGSSYLPSEISAAFLLAQLEAAQSITSKRLAIWDKYNDWAEQHELAGTLSRPVIPEHVTHNGHMFYILLPTLQLRTEFIEKMKNSGISTVFHYVPLHSSPGGNRFGRSHGDLSITSNVSERLVRLPLWVGIEDELQFVFDSADAALKR